MGMSSHVVGIRPQDQDYHRMKNAYDACKAADLDVPERVQEFFGYLKPDDQGVIVEIPRDAVSKYADDSRSGFDVDVTKLPEGVKIIRFYNSW